MFIDAGFVGGDLTKMIVVCPELVASQTAAQDAVGVARYLMDTYGLRRYDIRRIARSEPALLAVNRSKMIATTEVRSCAVERKWQRWAGWTTVKRTRR